MKLVFAFLIVIIVALVAADDRRNKVHRMPHEVRFQSWMSQNNKNYKDQKEYEMRLNNFIESTKKIAQMNAQSKALNSSAVFAHNEFSDLTYEEFSVRLGMKGYQPNFVPGTTVATANHVTAPPTSFDWSTRGGITAINNELQCGSCWAITVVESIESVYIIKKGKQNQVPLSAQQIVDCDTQDQGCNGGDPTTAVQYVQQAGGLETNADYPYKGEDGTCAAKKDLEQDPVTGFQYVIPEGSKDEVAMAGFLAANTPFSLVVDASTWQFYSGGVLSAAQCTNNVDHGVQAVGYNGLDSKGYWIIRNMWGTNWGEKGFIRVQFGMKVLVPSPPLHLYQQLHNLK